MRHGDRLHVVPDESERSGSIKA